MALIRDFDIPNTGLTASNAYHVVSNVKVVKRNFNVSPPPDPSREDLLTEDESNTRSDLEIYWKAGYIGHITILVYASKEARDGNKNPIGCISENLASSGVAPELYPKTVGGELQFMVDNTSTESVLTQAYNFLKTTEYYIECRNQGG
jgi:hypothetical protein